MPTVIVIFGVTGDLTTRKLIPALYNNFRKNRLPENLTIIGFARKPYTDNDFRDTLKEAVVEYAPSDYNEPQWLEFAVRLFYQQGDFKSSEPYSTLYAKIDEYGGPAVNCLYYLATAPEYYPSVVAHLAEANLLKEENQQGYRRIIVEKPLGHNLQSSLVLDHEFHRVLQENQIYRIDHYIGKETVQNLVVLRFGNAIFEPLWNRNYIDHVQISVAETVGVEHRAGYYDKVGVLRDIFQNHLLQILTLVAMEPPITIQADALRNEKVKVLTAMREIAKEHSARATVRAQYDGYTSEPGVEAHSTTETYAALRVFIDNWRWQGVPFYLSSGKMLKEKSSEITIQFRRPPTQILDMQAGKTELFTNRLSIIIQPDEGIHLRFITKVPDQGMKTMPAEMDFNYRDSFGEKAIPEAYERLLLDALNGDASLFARSDEIEKAWNFIDGVRSGWESEFAPPLLSYKRNTWGPAAADDLLGRDGRWWIHDCKVRHGNNPEPIT
jgi:glucose-6-phosphate 1-dehydrogenase